MVLLFNYLDLDLVEVEILTCVFENESCNFVQVTLRQFVFVDKLLGNLIRVLK